MQKFEEVWLERLKVLTTAMDTLISVDDFLAVTETHINEDCEQGIQAIVEKNGELLDRVAGCIRGRAVRVCDVVMYDMNKYPPSNYTVAVKSATRRFYDEGIFNDLMIKTQLFPYF
jgi:catenin alpha